jgi:hypothetical protein
MEPDRRKTQQWEFAQDASRRWYWRCLHRGSQSARSEQAFTSRTDCIADAMEHGYLETTPWVVQQAT